MADGFYYSAGAQISDHIRDVTISFESTQVINVTLGGDLHIQVLGDAIKVVHVTVFGTEGICETISECQALATAVEVQWDDRWIRGRIKEAPKWSGSAFRYYSAVVDVYVTSEGGLRCLPSQQEWKRR